MSDKWKKRRSRKRKFEGKKVSSLYKVNSFRCARAESFGTMPNTGPAKEQPDLLLICWPFELTLSCNNEVPHQRMLLGHSTRLEHGAFSVELNTLVLSLAQLVLNIFTFNSFKMLSILCFLFTSTAFPQKTSSFPISSSTSQPWSPTKNSSQIDCTRGESS